MKLCLTLIIWFQTEKMSEKKDITVFRYQILLSVHRLQILRLMVQEGETRGTGAAEGNNFSGVVVGS